MPSTAIKVPALPNGKREDKLRILIAHKTKEETWSGRELLTLPGSPRRTKMGKVNNAKNNYK